MPFETANPRTAPLLQFAEPASVDYAEPSFGETAGANFRLFNGVAAVVAQERTGLFGGFEPFDPDFEPLEEIKGTEFEANAASFVDVRNRRDFENVKADIEREKQDADIIARSGLVPNLVAGLAAGVIDPVILIPGGGLVKGVKGVSVARSALTFSMAGGVAETAAQGGLAAVRETETLEEAVVSIAATALLSGALGAGAAKLMSGKERAALAARIHDDMVIPDGPDPIDTLRGEFLDSQQNGSVGAAVSDVTSLADEGLAPAFFVEKLTRDLNPALRLSQSPSKFVRQVFQRLGENAMFLNKNADDIASPVAAETAMKQYQAGLANSFRGLNDAFTAFSQANKATGAPRMSRDEFEQAVGLAMRRGDVSENEFVQRAAERFRKEVFDPLKEQAIDQGLLPTGVDVTTAESYLSRLWNREAIAANEPEFREITREWAAGTAERSLAAEQRVFNRQINNLREERDALQMANARDQSSAEEGRVEFPEDLSQEQAVDMVRLVEQGRPQEPEGLTSFLARSGGLRDTQDELKAIGLTNRTRPGFIRQNGIRLDDAALKAWEEGFFPGFSERPSIREFLEALDDDFNKTRLRVREEDFGQARIVEDFDDVSRTLDEMGLNVRDPKDAIRGIQRGSRQIDELVAAVNKIKAARRGDAITRIEGKIRDLENDLRLKEEMEFDVHNNMDLYVDDIVESVTSKLKGMSHNDLPYDFVVSSRGPLAERVFDIEDLKVEQFLESNVKRVADRYTRVMGADVELSRAFDGDLTLEETIKEINFQYNRLAETAPDAKARTKLEKQRQQDIKDVEHVRDQLRGQFSGDPQNPFVRAARGLRQAQFLTKMGGVTVSSFPDVFRHVMAHGIERAFGDALVPLMTNMKGFRMAVEEAKRAGQITETVLNGRLATLAELGDPYARGTAFERTLDNLASFMSKANGMVYWNDFQKSVAAAMTQARMLDNALLGLNIKPAEKRYMAFLGMDASMRQRVAKQYRAHGVDEGGVKVANTHLWDDPDAVRTFRGALNKEVDSTIVSKGVADVPIWMTTDTGKTIGQFKSFAMASHQRVLIRGLQQRDAAFATGVASMVAGGMMVYYFKSLSSGRELSDDPRQWIVEGLDRSGLAAVFMEANNLGEKAGLPGLSRLAGAAPVSRFQSRNLAGTLAGPTSGFIGDVATVTRAVATGEVSEGDARTAARLMPFQNLFYARGVWEQMNGKE